MTFWDETPIVGGPRTPGKVLLVDDEPALRRIFRRALVRAGFDVVEATNGDDAFELVRNGAFEVVISDVRMAGIGGLELLDRLALEAPDLPVVLISGSAGFVDAATARGCGAFDYLEKPVELAQLRDRATRGVEAHRRRLEAEDEPRKSGMRRSAAVCQSDEAKPPAERAAHRPRQA